MITETRITNEIHAWQDRRRIISDDVALELFRQYRGSSECPFTGVGPTGIVDDAESLLEDIVVITDSLPLTGNIARFEELGALTGWVRNWQANHIDVDGYNRDCLNQVLEGLRRDREKGL